jgi:hypothetical protein
VGQDIFYAADEDQIGEALHIGADVAHGPGYADLGVAV